MICVALFLVVNAAYWRMASLGELTEGMVFGYWLAAIAWAVKLEVYRRREHREHRRMGRIR